MATELTTPFGGTDAVSLSTSGSSLFTPGSQIQADPVNNALRASSLISSVLAASLFTSNLSTETTNSSQENIAAKFKHLDFHMVTLSIPFNISINSGCYVCAVIPTINHQTQFESLADIMGYFDNTVRTFIASGYFVDNTPAYASSLQISSSAIGVIGIRTDSTPPTIKAVQLSNATVSDTVISIY